MLLFFTAVAIAGTAPVPSVQAAPVRQARAMVVIVKAARAGAVLPTPEDSVKRVAEVRDRDGTLHSLPLIEFF